MQDLSHEKPYPPSSPFLPGGIRFTPFTYLLSKFFIAESLPAVWFVAELHGSKIRIMIFFMFTPIALSFEAPIIKATSKDHSYWRALSGARRIV